MYPRISALAACLLALVSIGGVGCRDQVNDGFCRADSDCAPGQFCSQEQSSARWHRCFARDAEAGTDTAGMDVGAGPDVAANQDVQNDGGMDAPVDAAVDMVSDVDLGADVDASVDRVTDGTPDRAPEGTSDGGDAGDGGGGDDARTDGSDGAPRPCAADLECTQPGLPACDTATGKCAACSTNSHCSGPRMICDVTSLTCVGCVTGSDCPAGAPVCDPTTKACVRCLTRTDCSGAAPACDLTTKTCVGCLARTDCPATAPACDLTTKSCVGCLARTDCPATAPACDPATKACVACLARSDCPTTAPACDVATKVCVGCLARTDCPAAAPACDPMTRTCAECVTGADCGGTRPACDGTTRRCVGCLTAMHCGAPVPVCDTSAKACVGCLSRSDCGGTTPACDTAVKTCVGCLANSDCTAGRPVCDASTKLCVQCLTSAQCGGATPICERQMCRACAADAECVARGTAGGTAGSEPGVCMSHQDGRCASNAETIYVQNVPGCSTTPAPVPPGPVSMMMGGTAAVPYCRSQLAIDAVTPARRLVVLRGAPALFPFAVLTAGPQITVVGQNAATIDPGADVGIRLSAGNLFVRNLEVAGGSSIGVYADAGATLVLQRVVVDSNLGGGILIDGAGFSITNTSVTNNGPGQLMGFAWGGLRVQGLAVNASRNLTLVTVEGNDTSGLSCGGPVLATGLFAAGNGSADVSAACAIVPCMSIGPNCGAAP